MKIKKCFYYTGLACSLLLFSACRSSNTERSFTTESSINNQQTIDSLINSSLVGKWRFVKGYPSADVTVDIVDHLEPFGDEDSLYIPVNVQELLREEVWEDKDFNSKKGFAKNYYQFTDYDSMKQNYEDEVELRQEAEDEQIRSDIERKKSFEKQYKEMDSSYNLDEQVEKEIKELEKKIGTDHTSTMYSFKTLEDYNRLLQKTDFKVTDFDNFYFFSTDYDTSTYILLDDSKKLAFTTSFIDNSGERSKFEYIYLFEKVNISTST
ncbi:hypothetical protein E1Q28_002792, partial [Listeria monocytogenes]|nr:hypothetical protein [Listeria monocytogenes]EIU5654209.1 hypothetical protein [Listeria monocytogenes]HCJ2780521.1 hypothetical protein [Listeria monocytogenes]